MVNPVRKNSHNKIRLSNGVNRKMRVAVAMSGGVDSSTVAAILKHEGFEVIGVTMFFSLLDGKLVENAHRVANFLGVRHRVLDLTSILEQKVIKNFCQEYISGRTPNPCLRCNQYIKFGILLSKVLSWGCDFLATGHYARRLKLEKRFLLNKGRDKNKDQSYFLYRLSQKELKYILFPLGSLTKQKVVKISQRWDLPVTHSKESQEVCFLSGGDYRGFLKQRITASIEPGLVMDKAGNILGQHQGVPFYTLGQREGLNIALGYRAYVTSIDAKKNQIVLGGLRDAYGKELTVTKPNFIHKPLKNRVVYKVKIRYNHPEAEAEIKPWGKNLRVRFKRAQFSITPGQSAVFYQGDTVIGGGIIK